MILIRLAIIFAYYILGAYATTDILRLLSGASVSVQNDVCYCPHCHHPLRLRDQIPIFSYFLCHGKCRWCGAPIPSADTFLEIFILTGCTILAFAFHFSWHSWALSLIFYESTKFAFILIKKPRQTQFLPQLLKSFANNLVIFLLLAFLYFIRAIVI